MKDLIKPLVIATGVFIAQLVSAIFIANMIYDAYKSYNNKSDEYKKVCKQSGGTPVFNGIKNECIVVKKQGE